VSAEDDLKHQLDKAEIENRILRTLLDRNNIEFREVLSRLSSEPHARYLALSSEKKIRLFRSLFKGREDVYPRRWESRNGKSGYSPVCAHEWDRTLCQKPRIKCRECPNRRYLPLIDKVIHEHLIGKHVIGLYPLIEGDYCWFLAIDFDKSTWKHDATVFTGTCREYEIPYSLERSRSGNGCHIWIFFSEPIPAKTARNLGTLILTRSIELCHTIALDSYDRLFPNQDTLPKGGFGNLIALPLQKNVRANNNTEFLDDDFLPYPDQWDYLSKVRKLTNRQIDQLLQSHLSTVYLPQLPEIEDGIEGNPWIRKLENRRKINLSAITFPDNIEIRQANKIYIRKGGLPEEILGKLIMIAAFQNPEFYRAQAMRMSTFGKPRIIGCAEQSTQYIALPRGCLEEAAKLFEDYGITTKIKDERYTGKPLNASFVGNLNVLQEHALSALLEHDIGVLSAPTGFGKTVLAAKLISERNVNVLILVHRKHLLDQWREQLSLFLNRPLSEIGYIGGGKNNTNGFIDVGLLQSINRKGHIRDFVRDYGHVVVDECHHISAFSFEQVLKEVRAKFVLGLTATPVRKDGHHPIILMQCGPIHLQLSSRRFSAEQSFQPIVVPRKTDFTLPLFDADTGIQEIYSLLIKDVQRNNLIFDDILSSLEKGSTPLVLTERKEHLENLANRLRGFAKNIIVLQGGMSQKARTKMYSKLSNLGESEERVILATGRYAGEGFDYSKLDTLFLTMPISWRGTLKQYVGRLHRSHQGKETIRVYDYVDDNVAILRRMFSKRIKGYKSLGYTIEEHA
jgi:superfamily II DNA or RNA helicase